MDYTESPEGQYANMAAMEDEHREEERRLSRYDEAIRLLRAEVGTPALCWTDRKAIIEAFLAAEPADKETT